MGVYVGGGSGSGDTHTTQVISGGKKVAAKKAVKKTGIAAKKAAKKTAASPVVKSARAGKMGNMVTPRMARMQNQQM